jgi:transcription initiation factor TFIID TATA-box-binding protein
MIENDTTTTPGDDSMPEDAEAHAQGTEAEGDAESDGEGEEDDDAEEDEEDNVPTIQIKLQNVVATITLGCPIDLNKVAQTARNAEYNPTRFQAVIMRIREPRTTALIFASGKMIVTGAKTEGDCRNAAMKYKEILCKIGFPAECNDFKIQNITATFDAGFPIRLEAFIYAYSTNTTYEPELFPGLVYRMNDPKVVFLVFVSGKVIVTGAKHMESIAIGAQNIFSKLIEFRKRNVVIANPLLPK